MELYGHYYLFKTPPQWDTCYCETDCADVLTEICACVFSTFSDVGAAKKIKFI